MDVPYRGLRSPWFTACRVTEVSQQMASALWH
jgi:hypothetical protein